MQLAATHLGITIQGLVDRWVNRFPDFVSSEGGDGLGDDFVCHPDSNIPPAKISVMPTPLSSGPPISTCFTLQSTMQWLQMSDWLNLVTAIPSWWFCYMVTLRPPLAPFTGDHISASP